MLELNKEYTYKDICRILGWKETTGETREKQIKIIEESFEFYHPINQKTHKPKKSYIFTRWIKEPMLVDKRKNNGTNSLFPDEKFDYLLKCLLKTGQEQNVYFQRGKCNDVYVSSSLIYQEFGFDIYSILDDIKYNDNETEVQRLFKSICLDAVKSNTITRICKKFGYDKNSIPKGILRQEGARGKAAKILQPDNDLLPRYNELEKEFIKVKGCISIQDAIQSKKYFEIINDIQKKFEEENKYGVKRYNVISFEGELNFVYDREKKKMYQEHLYKVVITSIEKSVNNRINNTKKYKKKLNDWQKKLLQNYLEQLLGKETETIEGEPETEESDWLDLI